MTWPCWFNQRAVPHAVPWRDWWLRARGIPTSGRNRRRLLPVFDEAGITAAFLDPEYGGFIAGPKNLALALVAFELAWVDAGAATCSLAGNLGLAPIHECGTPEQRAQYMSQAASSRGGRKPPADPRGIRAHGTDPFRRGRNWNAERQGESGRMGRRQGTTAAGG